MTGKTSIAAMTDRSAEDSVVESGIACEFETGSDVPDDDQAVTELDHFLDHLDDIDREQRYFERYGTEHHYASPMEPGELAAPLVFELGNIRSLLANWAFVQSAMSIDDPDRLNSSADFAIALTGFCGPQEKDEEVGLVYLASATKEGRRFAQQCHFGDIGREAVLDHAVAAALAMMIETVEAQSAAPALA